MNSNEINHELKILEFERGMLNSELDRIYNKKWNKTHIISYVIGFCTTVGVSYMMLGAEPLLIGIISLVYGIGVPVTAVSIDYNKEEKLMKELKKIDARTFELNSKLSNGYSMEKRDNKKVGSELLDKGNYYTNKQKCIEELVNESNTKNVCVDVSKKKVRTIRGINRTKGKYHR